MGQGESKEIGFEDYLKQYKYIETLKDPHYGDAQLMESSDKRSFIVLKDQKFQCISEFTKQIDLLKKIQNDNHPNIVGVIDYFSQTSDTFCSTVSKLVWIMEYIKNDLFLEIRQRKLQQLPFNPTELKQIAFSCISALAKFQKEGKLYGDIRSSNILLTNSFQVKLIDPICEPSSSLLLQAISIPHLSRGTYLAPNLLRILKTKKTYSIPYQSSHKSEVFALGFVLMEACLLEEQDDCFDVPRGLINTKVYEQKFTLIEENFGEEITNIIKEMTILNENQRPDFIQLEQKLNLNVQMSKPLIIHNKDNSETAQDSSKEESQESILMNNIKRHPVGFFKHHFSYESFGSKGNQYTTDTHFEESSSNENQINDYFKPYSPSTTKFETSFPLQNKKENDEKQIEINLSLKDKSQRKSQLEGFSAYVQNNTNLHFEEIKFEKQGYHLSGGNKENANTENLNQNNAQIPVKESIKQNQLNSNKINLTLRQAQSKKETINKIYDEDYQYNKQVQLSANAHNKFKEISEIKQNSNQSDKYNHYNHSLILEKTQIFSIPNQSDQKYQFSPEFDVPPFIDNINLVKNNIICDQPNNFIQKLEYVEEKYQDGSVYIGEKLNGQRHGEGRFYYDDGGYYEGNWFEGSMDGYGKLFYPFGKIAYEGEWKKDKFNGKGTVYNDTPTALQNFCIYDFDNLDDGWFKYQGEFRDDQKEGKGTIELTNGCFLVGEFSNDKIEGPAVYLDTNGAKILGLFSQNNLLKLL